MFSIDSISSVIQNKFSFFVKKGISISPHFVPLNLKLLQRSFGIENNFRTQNDSSKVSSIRQFRDSIFNHLRNKYKNTIILKKDSFLVNGKSVLLSDLVSKYTPALVFTNNNSKDNLVGVLFNSYQTAGAELLNVEISKKINSQLEEVFGKDSTVDLAYILREEPNSTTGQKIKDFFGIFNTISDNSVSLPNINIPNDKVGITQSKILVESLLKDYAIYEERRFGTYSVSIDKEVSNFINSIKANILIIHDSSAKQEVKAIVESKGFIDKISKLLPEIKIFKNTFIEDIKNKIRNTFLGKSDKSIKEKAKTSSKIQTSKTQSKFTSSKGINSEFIIPPAYVSLTNLQNILNSYIAEYIKKNMGDGSRDDILNYRTGRLAKSFEVTGISQTRNGALSAFFTYMKYPYATFSRGGVQQYPITRDPKLLGEKAIRDIATNILKTRLRAVGI